MGLSQDWSGKLVGEYRLQRRLGGGSFGEVYLAEDVREHSQVAVKLIKTPLTQREDLKAFLNEARSMRLRHPHIVPLLDFGLSEQDLPFLVMEYVAGGTLRDRYPKGNRVSLSTVVDLTTQLASALQYAHDRHLVHRDVKPENMLCRTDSTVLLSDFGIASVAHASGSASAYQSFGGTLPYMAPEQHEGHPRPASDQYALAVVVYEWLAGTRPFQGTVPELISQHLHAPPPSLLNLVPILPAEVEQVVFKALSKQPQERFTRVDDFAVALQVANQRRVAPPNSASSSPPLTTPSERKQAVPGQGIGPDEARKGISLSALSPASSLPRTEANQPVSKKVPPTILPGAATITSKGFPDSTTPRPPVPVPHPTQYRRTPSRRVFFTGATATIVLVTLSIILVMRLFLFQPTNSQPGSQVPSSTTTPQHTATQVYFDNFSSYTPGQPPTGWLLRGASAVTPTIEEVGGTGPAYRLLNFPEVSWQYWDRWALKDGLVVVAPYVVTVKLNFQNSIADRAGLTIAWNDANQNRIDIQPNVYRHDIEFRVAYTDPIHSKVMITGPASQGGGLPISANTDYWLRISATSTSPGNGKVIVYWSTDDINFMAVETATGIANLTGLVGVGTAGPHLPHAYFDDFQVQ